MKRTCTLGWMCVCVLPSIDGIACRRSTTCLVQMVATRDIQMIVLPWPPSKRPRAPLSDKPASVRVHDASASKDVTPLE